MHTEIKQRYHFALSSFSRMYGLVHIQNNFEVKQFCTYWSLLEVNAPLGGLNEVDRYFIQEYQIWRNE